MKRRHFLQCAASTLASLGINALEFPKQGFRYQQALAQSAKTKRALLVGINEYKSPLRQLKGCVTDVELQRALLIHRFGFCDDDIVCLMDQDATRQNILNAFESHLIEKCGSEDIAVFHFSGHGRRIADPSPVRVAVGEDSLEEERDPENSTLIPYCDPEEEDEIPDIMGRTLFLLTSRLQTDKVTVVLDSCYAEGGIRGGVRVRGGGRQRSLKPSKAELDYQEELRRKLDMSWGEIQELRDMSIAKGIALVAARRNQEAADVTFGTTNSGATFDAGAFTYFLTQYLWHEEETVNQVIENVSRNLEDDTFSQDPTACIAPFECSSRNRENTSTPTYFANPLETDQTPSAEGVIRRVNRKRGTVWFGGSDHYSLETYGTGAKFTAIAPDGTQLSDGVIVWWRRGLMAEVILPDDVDLPEGTLLQESSRIIPKDYKLRIGIDPSVMQDLEKVRTTFDSVRRLELVPYQSDERPYFGEVHYILSRMTSDYRALFSSPQRMRLPDNDLSKDSETNSVSTLPEQDSLIIASPGLDEIIPGSWGVVGESIEEASDRLATKFNSLIAARLLKLLINANSARLNINAKMEVVGERSSHLAQFFTVRGSQNEQQSSSVGLLEVPMGKAIQFTVTHQEPNPIYLLVLIVDRTGDIFPVFPRRLLGITAEVTMIEPNQPKLVPDPIADPPLNADELGFGEVLVIASRTPLNQAMQALSRDRRGTAPVIDALIGDLSGFRQDVRSGGNNEFRITATNMAAMSIPFRVV